MYNPKSAKGNYGVRQACFIISLLLYYLIITVSCNQKEKNEKQIPLAAGSNPVFILEMSADRKNVDSVRKLTQNDLLPILGNRMDVKSVKVFETISEKEEGHFIVLIEVLRADRKGIFINEDGRVVRVDFSQFLQVATKDEGVLKRLSVLNDLVRSHELKAYKTHHDLSMNREVSGSVK